MSIYHKGVTPIEKNIIVLDDQGNEYEATYPKRAKGLVKSGRARFVDEKTICLACPPANMEDNVMSEEKILNDKTDVSKLTMDYVLTQIENIAAQTAYLNEAITEISKIPTSSPVAYAPPDIAGKAKVDALGDVVRCRETTTQQLLTFYEKVYDDLKSVRLSRELSSGFMTITAE